MCLWTHQSIHLTYYLQGFVMGTISGLEPFSVRALLIARLQEHFWCKDMKEEGGWRRKRFVSYYWSCGDFDLRFARTSTNVWRSSAWQTFLSQWNSSIYTMNWNLGKHEKGLNGEILKWQIGLITTVTKSSETFTCALFCINWQLVLLRIRHTTVRKIRFKM